MAGGGIRAARNMSAAAVATIAAWSSYYHMVHVALHYGERPEVAYGLPFSVDGMLVVATIVMVDDKHRTHRVRPMARLAFTAAVIASIAANIAAAHPNAGARIIDAWPALALLLVVEMLARPPATAHPRTSTGSAAPLAAHAGQAVDGPTELPAAPEIAADPSASAVPAEPPATMEVPAPVHSDGAAAADVPPMTLVPRHGAFAAEPGIPTAAPEHSRHLQIADAMNPTSPAACPHAGNTDVTPTSAAACSSTRADPSPAATQCTLSCATDVWRRTTRSGNGAWRAAAGSRDCRSA
jgi:hypothetical protein